MFTNYMMPDSLCKWRQSGKDSCASRYRKRKLFLKELFYWIRMFMHAQCVWLFATPWTVTCQAPLSVEFCRQDYWSGFPFPPPGNLPDPGIQPMSLALAGGFCTTEPPGNPYSVRTSRSKNNVVLILLPSVNDSWYLILIWHLKSWNEVLFFKK